MENYDLFKEIKYNLGFMRIAKPFRECQINPVEAWGGGGGDFRQKKLGTKEKNFIKMIK